MTENAVEAQPTDWVHMHHPETGGVTRTTREAFELTWSQKGWVEADTAKLAATELTGGQIDDLTKLTVAELEDLATARGIALPDGAKKPQIVETLEQAGAPQP